MHPEAIKAVARKLALVAENVIYPQGHELAGGKILGVGTGRETFSYTSDGHDAEQAVLAELLQKRQWREKWSETHVQRRLIAIVRKALEAKSTEPIQQEVERLVAEYEQFREQMTIYVPLVGIQVPAGRRIQLGKVTLLNMTEETAATFKERLRSIVMQNSYYTVEQRHAIVRDNEEHWIPKLMNGACAEITVIAENERAVEIALEKTRRVLDLLRFAALAINPFRHRHIIGLQGDESDGLRVVIGINDGDTGAYYSGHRCAMRFSLHPRALGAMRSLGIFDLADLLESHERTEFETVILRAVHWLASAQSQDEPANSLLNLVTCLETFLKPTAGDPISATIAEGVAILIASGLEDRKRVKRRIRCFYDKRSKLTHEGDANVDEAVLKADVDELAGMARALTVHLTRRRQEFRTQAALREWIDDQKLSGPTASADGERAEVDE